MVSSPATLWLRPGRAASAVRVATAVAWAIPTVRAASAIRANAAIPSDSPRSPGSTPAALSTAPAWAGDPAHVASAARSVLRRCPKAASITRKTSSRLTGTTGDSCRLERDELGVHVRDRPEDAARHRPGQPRRRVPGQLRRRGTVDPAAGSRAHPVRDLSLDHDDAPRDRREGGQQVQQHWNRDVVRQVGGDCRRGWNFRGPDPESVRLDDGDAADVGRGAAGDRLGQLGGQHRVDLDRDDPGDKAPPDASIRASVSGAESRADLQDHVVGRERPRDRGDLPDRAWLDDEVLPELLGWLDPEAAGDRPDVPRPQQPHPQQRSWSPPPPLGRAASYAIA